MILAEVEVSLAEWWLKRCGQPALLPMLGVLIRQHLRCYRNLLRREALLYKSAGPVFLLFGPVDELLNCQLMLFPGLPRKDSLRNFELLARGMPESFSGLVLEVFGVLL